MSCPPKLTELLRLRATVLGSDHQAITATTLHALFTSLSVCTENKSMVLTVALVSCRLMDTAITLSSCPYHLYSGSFYKYRRYMSVGRYYHSTTAAGLEQVVWTMTCFHAPAIKFTENVDGSGNCTGIWSGGPCFLTVHNLRFDFSIFFHFL